jgi:hypothetical protein
VAIVVLALLVGLGVFLVSLLTFGTATALIVHMVVRLFQKAQVGFGVWKNVAVMMIVSLITTLVHLVQIALWALAILLCGEISTFETAFYWSAQNYTALGYGDVVLSGPWRLLGPLESINGLLLFGLSTAVIFAIMSRLVAHRLHPQPPFPGGTAASPEDSSVANRTSAENA